MRSMTRSEVAVVGALLPSLALGERERIRLAQVPRTTYQTVRQRALAQGWIAERYVPCPELVHARVLRLGLLQPFAEHHAGAVARLAADPATVLLWDTPDSILALAVETDSRPGSALAGFSAGPAAATRLLHRSWVVA